MTAATTQAEPETIPAGEPPAKTDFRITTYWKRPRNQPGLTQAATKRVSIGLALDWILDELPEGSAVVTPDTEGDRDAVAIRIDWTKVPDEIRYGTCGPRGYR